MTRVLLTAFQPYENWSTNASWLAIVELTRHLPAEPNVTTRLYPVDFEAIYDRVTGDLSDHYDYVILTGQAPGRTRIEIETVALNLASEGAGQPIRPLTDDGPLAYSSGLPAESFCSAIRQAGIPAAVSHHGGTFLCNAALYFALHHIASERLPSEAVFIHLPLDTEQVAQQDEPLASLPAAMSAEALRIVVRSLAETAKTA